MASQVTHNLTPNTPGPSKRHKRPPRAAADPPKKTHGRASAGAPHDGFRPERSGKGAGADWFSRAARRHPRGREHAPFRWRSAPATFRCIRARAGKPAPSECQPLSSSTGAPIKCGGQADQLAQRTHHTGRLRLAMRLDTRHPRIIVGGEDCHIRPWHSHSITYGDHRGRMVRARAFSSKDARGTPW
jgi:hypothetical protein